MRVVLFTDVQPNVGPTAPSAFEDLVQAGADDGVHITVVALGLGVGTEILQSMAQVRGGNAFGIQQADGVDTFMADQYPWFTTPIAYDLAVTVRHSSGLAIETPYGFPTGFAEDARLDVATVFLSKNKGALLMSMVETDDGALDGAFADADVAWQNPSGVARTATLRTARDGAVLDERGHWFAQPATARTTALALLVSGMHDAAAAYGGYPAVALDIMRTTQARFAADAAAIGDADPRARGRAGRRHARPHRATRAAGDAVRPVTSARARLRCHCRTHAAARTPAISTRKPIGITLSGAPPSRLA